MFKFSVVRTNFLFLSLISSYVVTNTLNFTSKPQKYFSDVNISKIVFKLVIFGAFSHKNINRRKREAKTPTKQQSFHFNYFLISAIIIFCELVSKLKFSTPTRSNITLITVSPTHSDSFEHKKISAPKSHYANLSPRTERCVYSRDLFRLVSINVILALPPSRDTKVYGNHAWPPFFRSLPLSFFGKNRVDHKENIERQKISRQGIHVNIS